MSVPVGPSCASVKGQVSLGDGRTDAKEVDGLLRRELHLLAGQQERKGAGPGLAACAIHGGSAGKRTAAKPRYPLLLECLLVRKIAGRKAVAASFTVLDGHNVVSRE